MNPIHRLPALLVAVVLGIASAAFVAPQAAHAQAATPGSAPAPATADAPKPATPAPPPGAGQDVAPQKEVVENPYGLEALWKQGDFVSRGTLIILTIMSFAPSSLLFSTLSCH